jgi:aldehyde dehydrogenase (NAD+)
MTTVNTATSNIERIYLAQLANRQNVGNTTASERSKKLKALRKALLDFSPQIKDAIYADFRKPAAESDLTEIFTVKSQINLALRELPRWMRNQEVDTKLALFGTSSYIKYEPKGLALIISPWNYPIDLTLGPLVSAIAAGCTAVVKPSELTPHTSEVLEKLIKSVFEENEVAVIQGDASVSQTLLAMKFNHIFFTGAPSIGKVVMRAAAEHLTSVTLELGGKSPTIVDETANISLAAKRILFGKFVNCGQTCIAPDYLFVHESKKEALISEMKSQLNTMYGTSETEQKNSDLPRVVNNRHFNRLRLTLEDAIQKGAKIEYGAKLDGNENFFSPTLLSSVSNDMQVLQDEIFGPILPIMTYKNLSEVSDYINNGEKPLAMYIFSGSKKNQEFLLNNTSSGGVSINETLLHVANYELPFGGVNNSGIGKSHGVFGFKEFSNERAVLKRWIPISAIDLLAPPYNTAKVKNITKLMLRFFS